MMAIMHADRYLPYDNRDGNSTWEPSVWDAWTHDFLPGSSLHRCSFHRQRWICPRIWQRISEDHNYQRSGNHCIRQDGWVSRCIQGCRLGTRYYLQEHKEL